MTKWEEFQKRYRLLGIDDGGLDALHSGGETKEAPAKESKKEKKDKAAGSRTPRLSKGRNNADTLTPHDTSISGSDGGNAGSSSKKDSKKAKKDKRDSKKKDSKKDKRKSRSAIVRREGGEAGGGERDCSNNSSSSGSECEDGADAAAATGGSRQASSSSGGEKRGLGHRMRMSMRLGSREEISASQPPNAGTSPTEYGSLRLPLSARRGVNPLLLGSFPNRGMDRALSDEVDSIPLTAGRKRLASSPARVQVGRWERRTFHSGEVPLPSSVARLLLVC
jgi:hypothetical protein